MNEIRVRFTVHEFVITLPALYSCAACQLEWDTSRNRHRICALAVLVTLEPASFTRHTYGF